MWTDSTGVEVLSGMGLYHEERFGLRPSSHDLTMQRIQFLLFGVPARAWCTAFAHVGKSFPLMQRILFLLFAVPARAWCSAFAHVGKSSPDVASLYLLTFSGYWRILKKGALPPRWLDVYFQGGLRVEKRYERNSDGFIEKIQDKQFSKKRHM